MGEVYKARDTRLDRSVAIKVLPSSLAADPEFRERFDREARAISQLSHPNICTLYDVGDHEGTAYLVMELLDGQTLDARIAKGAMPLTEALPIAIQIGDALAAAHRAGLVHRDLKPGNVMLTKSGAKLLDFGLAKAAGITTSAAAGATMMATTPPAMTAQGSIVGTFQYMAPEQVEGHDADARSDIFAFGCVLYETLTGKKAFEGKTHASLIGAIMHAEPAPLSGIIASIPVPLDRVVRKCLAKDPDARWQTVRDLADELKWIAETGGRSEASASTLAHATTSSRVPWMLAVVSMLVAASAGAALLMTRRRPPAGSSAPIVRLALTMPDDWLLSSFGGPIALSPDERYVALAGGKRSQATGLWLRPLDAVEATLIPHTEHAAMPFWSPDGQWLGFYDQATRQLKKTDVSGGQTSIICEAMSPLGAAWGRDGVILFGGLDGTRKVPAAGGTPVLVLKALNSTGAHTQPAFLADGKHFLYKIFRTGLYVAALDGTESHQVRAALTGDFALIDDELFYMNESTIVSQHVDLKTFALNGEPRVRVSNAAEFVATSSVLVHAPLRAGNEDELAWFDRTGQRLGTLGDRADYSNVELSPDGTRLATAILVPRLRTRDIWTYDVARSIRQRFTFSDADERTAVWSPDGRRILYNVRGKQIALDFFQRPSDGSGREEPVLVDGRSKDPLGWSPDGHHLLYRVSGNNAGNDLWVLPAVGDKKPFPYSATPFEEQDGKISPDSRWAAYSTDESGELEVYVSRFPAGGAKTRISSAGGNHPRWRRDGKELFYLSPDGKIVAADITSAADAVRVGDVHPLFEIHPPVQPGYVYDVTPDGEKFLVITDVSASPAPIVVLNWRTGK